MIRRSLPFSNYLLDYDKQGEGSMSDNLIRGRKKYRPIMIISLTKFVKIYRISTYAYLNQDILNTSDASLNQEYQSHYKQNFINHNPMINS